MQAPTLNTITQGQHLASKAVDHDNDPDPIVYAPEDGKIVFYGQAGTPNTLDDAGNQLRLQGATGLHAFGHLEKTLVTVGTNVKRGQAIAVMGYTGYTLPDNVPAGAHVHYWIQRPDGTYVYPPTLYKDNFIKGEQIAMPTKENVINQFKNYLRRDPTPEQIAYYTARGWNVLNDDILVTLKRESDNSIKARDNTIVEKNKVIDTKNKEIVRLNSILGEAGKWETLRTLLREFLGIK